MVVDLPEHDREGSIDSYLAMWTHTRMLLLRELDELDDDALDFHSDSRIIESVGTQLYHIAGVEWSWILEDIGGKEFEFEKWKHAFALRKNVDTDQVRGKSKEFYLDLLDTTRNEVFEFLSRFNDDDLSKEVIEDHTLRWILYHVFEHELTHLGQIRLLKRLHKLSKK